MSRKRKAIPIAAPVTTVEGQKLALRVIASEATFKPETYEFDDSFKAGNPAQFRSVHTVPELMECLKRTDTEAEGVFLEATENGVYRYRRLKSKADIQEAWKRNARVKKFREAKIREDAFANDSNGGLVGDDFVPLLGGPFNKQPYLYDYLRAHSYCFFEYHHHPFARNIVHTTRDFVLGRGYRIDCDDQKALALWRAFEEVNNLEQMMEQVVLEGSIYGENMIWWLPNFATSIGYQDAPGQEPSKGIIPRIRLMDPSTCWEIVTYPEDITRVLYYQFVYPTQYQIFTGSAGGSQVPSSKFIMQQVPAPELMHFKYNCVSNEKRGRSDLFPVLGYLKWVKDCVNYKLIALKKQAAWTEDIEVEGSQADVDNLSASLKALGSFEPAGSRFIHTAKIKRTYLANAGGSSADDETLSWGVDMIAVGSQIPASYFGLLKSAGQTRASALIGTEPVAKKFERRQLEVKRILQALWKRFHDKYGVQGAECTITFPEIITQDRSQKLKDIKFTEDCGYISRETAAPLAAKELDIDNYDYPTEKKDIEAEGAGEHLDPTIMAPLTAPSAAPAGSTGQPALKTVGSGATTSPRKPSAVTSQDRAAIAQKDGGHAPA